MADIRKRTGKKGATYQVRYADPSSKTGFSYATFETRKEAMAFRESGEMHKKGVTRAADVWTVERGLQKWLDVCEKEGRNGRDPVTKDTLKGYQWRRDCILKYGWAKALPELTPPDVVAFRSWLITTYGHDLARSFLLSFHSMVLELVMRGILPHDFASGITVHETSRYDEPVIIPTEKEIHALLAAADRLANSKNKQTKRVWQRYRPMLYLAVDSGMRPQEYIVVPIKNIHDKGVLVSQALESGDRRISVPKTQAGRRFIELSPETISMLRHYAEQHDEEKNTFDLVFPTSSWTWQSPDNWRKRGFSMVCEEAGMMVKAGVDAAGEPIYRPKYTPYALRHFYASMLIEQRTNLKRIQKLMGHEKIETTLNVYGHLIERKEAQSEERTGMLAKLREGACGKSVASPSEAAEIRPS